MSPFETVSLEVKPNMELVVRQDDHTLAVTLYDENRQMLKEILSGLSESRVMHNKRNNELLKDVEFAKPLSLDNHPCIKL